jgi:FtsH-binding integral membrane protein
MANPSVYNRYWGIRQGGSLAKVSALLFEKKELLVMTFANLLVQALITFYALKKYSTEKKNRYVNIGVWIGLFAIVLLLSLVAMPTWMKFLLFCIFSYGWGYTLSDVASFDTMYHAWFGAVSIFGVMFALGLMMIVSGIHLGVKTGIVLFYTLLGLILATLFTTSKILTYVGILLFSIYILYDTNRILQKNYYGDFITASLDYYLDLMNLFVNLVNLNQD